MAEISTTLNWEGVWEIKEDHIPSTIPDEEGIYMVICGRRSESPINGTSHPMNYYILEKLKKSALELLGMKSDQM